jgi:hypothetical protein
MTTQHWLDVLGGVLMFVGGLVLTVDALTVRRRARRDRGATILNEILQGDNPVKDLEGRSLQDRTNLELWLSRAPLRRTWIGFLLTTLGFLLDLAGKLLP